MGWRWEGVGPRLLSPGTHSSLLGGGGGPQGLYRKLAELDVSRAQDGDDKDVVERSRSPRVVLTTRRHREIQLPYAGPVRLLGLRSRLQPHSGLAGSRGARSLVIWPPDGMKRVRALRRFLKVTAYASKRPDTHTRARANTHKHDGARANLDGCGRMAGSVNDAGPEEGKETGNTPPRQHSRRPACLL